MTLIDLLRFTFLIGTKELRIKRDRELNIKYFEIKPDLDKVKSCIYSCKNRVQLESASRMIKIFYRRHKDLSLLIELKRDYRNKLVNILY